MQPRIPNTIPRIPKIPSELELFVDSVVVAGLGDGDAVVVTPVSVGAGLVALCGAGVVPVPGVPPEAGVGELGVVDGVEGVVDGVEGVVDGVEGVVDGVEGVPDPPLASVGFGVLWDDVGAGVDPELEPPVAPLPPVVQSPAAEVPELLHFPSGHAVFTPPTQ